MGYILLVEDEVLLAFMLMADLNAATAIPVEAYNSTEKAFERLAKGAPALAFLDINLGNMTSFAIAEWLVDRQVPTYFVTSYSLASLEKMKIPASLSSVGVIPKVEFRNKITDLLPHIDERWRRAKRN